MNKLVPKEMVESIYQIDLDRLWLQGKRGIITDLDNTLVGAEDPLATPELVAWLKSIRERGWKVAIVSNNNRTRVSAFAEPLNVPFLHSARKPSARAFVQAMQALQTDTAETVVVGDQMLTDVLGGNRLGMHTVLVKPVSLAGEGIFTRFNRRLEKIAVSRLKKQGHHMFKEEKR
ncbi:YqeG family HAD IIIA-type phosphatase [Xylanibacillus composti]|nr:YqeG family HAD IIIA-type phosphatase [Xylanibacillus composti]